MNGQLLGQISGAGMIPASSGIAVTLVRMSASLTAAWTRSRALSARSWFQLRS